MGAQSTTIQMFLLRRFQLTVSRIVRLVPEMKSQALRNQNNMHASENLAAGRPHPVLTKVLLREVAFTQSMS
jgi:hypothetical protein